MEIPEHLKILVHKGITYHSKIESGCMGCVFNDPAHQLLVSDCEKVHCYFYDEKLSLIYLLEEPCSTSIPSQKLSDNSISKS